MTDESQGNTARILDAILESAKGFDFAAYARSRCEPSPDRASEPTAKRMDSVATMITNLGISRSTLYRLEQSGDLVPVRIGGRVLYDPDDVDAFVQKLKKAAAESATAPKTEPNN